MNKIRLHKKEAGSFYTPQPLAQLLAKEVLSHVPPANLQQLHILDPAAGEGGLLLPFACELAKQRHTQETHKTRNEILQDILARQLYAADISGQALAKIPLPAAHCYVGDSLDVYQHQSVLEYTFKTKFDIILANPPYIGQKGHAPIFNKLRRNPMWKEYVTPKNDLLYYFFYLTLHLLKPGGLAGFITPPYFSTAQGGKVLRQTLHDQATFLRLINFEEKHLFTEADPHTLLSVFQKGKLTLPCKVGWEHITPVKQTHLFYGADSFLQTHATNQTHDLLARMAKAPYALGEIASVSNGLMTGCDRAFILTEAQKNALSLTQKELAKLRPFFKNSDIHAYIPNTQPRLWLIDFFYPNDRDMNVKNYPHLLSHLTQFKTKLLARKQNNNGIDKQLAKGNFWFGSVRRKMNFEGEKIVLPHRGRTVSAAYSNGSWYASSDVYFISNPKSPHTLWSILGLLNSAPYLAWLQTNGKRKGELLELYSAPLKQLPIPKLTPQKQANLEELTRQIFAQTHAGNSTDIAKLQKQLDKLVESCF